MRARLCWLGLAAAGAVLVIPILAAVGNLLRADTWLDRDRLVASGSALWGLLRLLHWLVSRLDALESRMGWGRSTP